MNNFSKTNIAAFLCGSVGIVSSALAASFVPGSYQGEAMGRNGPIVVDVTVSKDRIDAVKIISQKETDAIAGEPLKELSTKILQNQSIGLDTFSGATLSSQGFIKAVEAALSKATSDISSVKKPVAKKAAIAPKDTNTDVVIIGAGCAGLTAAIAAAEQGKKVIVLDKQGIIGGGDTVRISSWLGGAESKTTRATGHPEATVKSFYDRVIKEAEKKNVPVDKANVYAYTMRSGELADWLIDLGVPYGKYNIKTYKHHTTDGSAPGPHIVRVLTKKAKELGIDIRLNSNVTSILTRGGKADGVDVSTKDGNYKIHAKAVIVATGGYTGSPSYLQQYASRWAGRPSTAAPSSTGDGIAMAEKVGANIVNMKEVKVNWLAHPLNDKLAVSMI